MNDPKSWLAILATVALGACAVLLVWKGDVSHALTFAALLVPSAGQFLPKAAPPGSSSLTVDVAPPVKP
jgi:hypothetical protein